MRGGPLRGTSGVTLVELMVAVAILTVGILGFFGAFRFITRSLHVSRTQTLATNLAQEKIEELKNLSYYDLLITTPTFGVDSSISPSVTYDQNNYPPETIMIGNVNFTRYTFVAMAQIDNDVISTVTYTYPDTGMKQITSTILWTDDRGNRRSWSLTNLLENPNVNPLDSSISGTVQTSGGTGLASAVVRVEQNPDWNTLTDASGNYSFRVYHGSYTILASSAGYWSADSNYISANAGSNTTVPTIQLGLISSGTVEGEAWIDSEPVVSQVMAGSVTYVGTAGGGIAPQTVEYIELFNPTTAEVDLASPGGPPVKINVNVQSQNAGHDATDLVTTYVSTYIPPYSYYLIGNASFFLYAGQWAHADGYYSGTSIDPTACGDVYLTDASGNTVSQVGWTTGGACAAGRPTYASGNPIAIPGGFSGGQLVRVSSPAASVTDIMTYGRAYSSQDNPNDFLYPTIAGFGYTGQTVFPPWHVGQTTVPVISGVPAVGAWVAASDLYSGETQVPSAYVSSGSLNLLIAPFTLTGVSTTPAAGSCNGECWTVTIASNDWYTQIASVAVPNSGSVASIPGQYTSPAYVNAGVYQNVLSSSSTGGFVRGQVTDVNNRPIAGIEIGGTTKWTNQNGEYFDVVSSGTVTLVANPNNLNPAYVQQITAVNVNSGQIVTQNFTLTQGASVTGYLTSGTTPLPNYPVVAYAGDGSQAGQGTSNTSGAFTIHNLSTGTYTIQPVLDVGQSDSCASAGGYCIDYYATLSLTSPAQTVFVATFTVSGALGAIGGSIKYNSASLTSGALLVASTATISSTPQTIVASSAPAYGAVIYAISSLADGTYSLPVRGGGTYYLSVYVPVVNNSGSVTVTTKTYSGIYVTPSNTTTENVTVP